MKHEAYEVSGVFGEFDAFDFVSSGKNGIVLKRVVFAPTPEREVVNLVLGDVGADGEVDDRVISNNGDRDKVLATVLRIINYYHRWYPERAISIEGNTAARNRLYRMVISIYQEELSNSYEESHKFDIWISL
ncbi:MAG TPA: hypothetical protein VL547_02560 [Dinghuibacter sp.]|uniref:DUF6934 family protein n=1 Tax=Dinghuibacter sp. TaxID=2024697 RepID=UPI002CC8B6A9|nr:hypothetical protein [Dinghuibacter sp.]HTJ10875.1 hypothetical protein [Dinghuibacter sp.]